MLKKKWPPEIHMSLTWSNNNILRWHRKCKENVFIFMLNISLKTYNKKTSFICKMIRAYHWIKIQVHTVAMFHERGGDGEQCMYCATQKTSDCILDIHTFNAGDSKPKKKPVSNVLVVQYMCVALKA